MLPPVLIPLLVYAPMLVEARRAARNEAAQRLRGGIEPAGDVYAVMRVVYPLSFGAMIVEGLAWGRPATGVVVAGVMVFAAAKALKWWAIRTLAQAWTFRVIVVPGSDRVVSGPYRFLRHPNYLGVIGELVGVALMTGARVSGPIGVAGFAILIVRRIAVESRALDAILRRT